MNQIGTHFGTIFGSNMIKNGPERGSKKCFKKGYPSRVKRYFVCTPGSSWRRRLACAFSTTETTAQTATAATTATVAEIAAPVQFLFEFVVRIRLFLDAAVQISVSTMFL